jgi:uncharacterized membrane protein YciS (DUF1049 family)
MTDSQRREIRAKGFYRISCFLFPVFFLAGIAVGMMINQFMMAQQ